MFKLSVIILISMFVIGETMWLFRLKNRALIRMSDKYYKSSKKFSTIPFESETSGCKTLDSQRVPVKVSENIVDGEEIKIEKAPYAVALLRAPEMDQFCGGSIISLHWVLTAAHCLCYFNGTREERIEDLYIGSGNEYHPNSTKHKVLEFKCHHDFNEEIEYDIALVMVKEPFNLNDSSHVEKSAPCNRIPVEMFAGQEAYAVGWGTVDYNGTEKSLYLRKAVLKIKSKKECEKALSEPDRSLLNSKSFCSVYHKGDTCKSDSGGPIIVDGFIVGIVSIGTPTNDFRCGPEQVTINVDIQSYLHWIKETMHEVEQNI